ncbi:MAG TPA: carboxymuconolactone decarboxylase family protein [Pseudomonadales bacterium]
MANVEPADRNTLAELEGVFAGVEASMGFLPNSMLTMAHMPQLTMSFAMLASVVFGADLKGLMASFADRVPEVGGESEGLAPGLVQLVAFAVSVASGCRYCQAHTSHNAHRLGEPSDKLANVLAFDTDPSYTDAERAAVSLALAAGQVPNAARPEHFEALRTHFSERQIVQIVAVISLFGYLNRWNDTMATLLEAAPREFAERALGSLDWAPGKHDG